MQPRARSARAEGDVDTVQREAPHVEIPTDGARDVAEGDRVTQGSEYGVAPDAVASDIAECPPLVVERIRTVPEADPVSAPDNARDVAVGVSRRLGFLSGEESAVASDDSQWVHAEEDGRAQRRDRRTDGLPVDC